MKQGIWWPGLGALLLALGGAPAVAADAPADAPAAQELDAVVVTGTRSAERTVVTSLAPIDVIAAEDIARTGAPDLPTALRTLLPALNFPQPAITGAADAVPPVQLRGMAPDQVLVLVNGKRQHGSALLNVGPAIGRGSAPVDLAAIPVDAIERVEVLRDGAAAQYGSDAIAGVINIILKGGAEGGAARVGYGRHDGGQGRTITGGFDTGLPLGAGGWLHLAASYLNQEPTSHPGRDLRFPSDPTWNQPVIRFGLPRQVARRAALNAQLPLGDVATLYAFGLFNRSDVVTGGSFRSLSDYKDSAPEAVVTYPAGFAPFTRNAMRADTEAVGLRGAAGGWDWDLALASGGDHNKIDVSRSFNFSLGAASPTAFAAGTAVVRQNELTADFRRAFAMPWDAPLTLAWGLAWRQEKFALKAGEEAAWTGLGAQGGSGFGPDDARGHRRSNRAAYLDLETDFSARLAAGAAVRHERYSDFGSTTSWKLALRQAFTPALALRATLATGFRAPALQQQFHATTGIEFAKVGTGTAPFIIRTFPVADPAAVALGAQPLRPEKSRNASLGLVLTPAAGPWLTLDLYQIRVSNRIVLSGNLVGDAVRDYLAAAGFPGVGGGRFFTNAIDTRTRGADLVGTWPLALANSDLRLSAGLNHNRTRVTAVAPNPPQLGLAGLELPIITRDERGRIEVGTPRSKAFISGNWERGAWTLHAQATRYGPFTSRGAGPAGDQTYGARVLLDAGVSWRRAGWTLSAAVDNLTNVYPEQNNAMNDFAGNIRYPFGSPFGFSGSYWNLQASRAW